MAVQPLVLAGHRAGAGCPAGEEEVWGGEGRTEREERELTLYFRTKREKEN